MGAPLEGIRILDLSRLLPGPFCTMILADLGAEIVKVEDPVQGDYVRWLPPYIGKTGVRFLVLNRNKKSITLNLKDPRGVEILLELVKNYDVVVDSFRPGVLERLGVGYETASKLNPAIIYCSLTGYGKDGPYSMRAGHDINYVGYTGVLSLTGEKGRKPVLPGVQVGDLAGAMSAVIAIQAAIIERAKTGKGQALDVSLADAAFSLLPMDVGAIEAGEPVPRAGQTTLTGLQACYGTYETADGKYVGLGAIEPKFFKKFCELVGREDLEVAHFSTGEEAEKLRVELTELFKTKTQKEWCDLLEEQEVCFGPVNGLDEALEDPQLLHRGMVINVPLADGSEMRQTGLPFKLSRTPPVEPAPPPEIGQHTAEVLAQIGIADADLAELEAKGIVRSEG